MLDGFFLVDERTSVPVPAGCDVCVDPDASLFLTLTCPTNIGQFPNASIRGYRWTENNTILSVSPFLSVSSPGEYTCTVLFDGDESDSATSIVSCKLTLNVLVNLHTYTSLCFYRCTRCGN